LRIDARRVRGGRRCDDAVQDGVVESGLANDLKGGQQAGNVVISVNSVGSAMPMALASPGTSNLH
jgi:hypothetical protein